MSSLSEIQQIIRAAGNPEKAIFLMRFFKTAEGQYGHDDVFLGLTVPQSRLIAGRYVTLPLKEVEQLLHSKYHEERLTALVILTLQYKKGDQEKKKEIYDLYLANTKHINNWDLVDLSAEYIVGDYLYQTQNQTEQNADIGTRHPGKRSASRISQMGVRDSAPLLGSSRLACLADGQAEDDGVKKILSKLARSSDLWERRIAIISTFAWIKKGESDMTFAVAELLLSDKEDLIHKAVGWMLREVGKRCSEQDEEEFLKSRYKTMPRTMLRYAIERFPEEKRKSYLLGKV